jgi:hypothetical protein
VNTEDIDDFYQTAVIRASNLKSKEETSYVQKDSFLYGFF